MMFTNV